MKRILIGLALIAVLSVLVSYRATLQTSDNLSYFFLDPNRYPFSTSPEDCDFFSNAIVLEQVVGTLIQLGQSGQYEDYIAERWQSSEDGKSWDFFLRKNLKTENNELITAKAYKKNLERLFKLYIKDDGSLLSLDLLAGLDQFKKGATDVSGIQAINDNQLRFIFIKKPMGLLQDLSITQFGFFSEKDFINGEWANNKKISSSGAYALDSWGTDTIILKKRPNWFSHVKNSARKVTVKLSTEEALSKTKIDSGYSIIQRHIEDEKDILPGYTTLKSTPMRLTNIVLSPFLGFKDISHRKWFQKRLHDVKKLRSFESLKAIETDTFFFDGKRSQSEYIDVSDNFLNDKKISVAIWIDGAKEYQYMRDLITDVFQDTGASVQFTDFSKIRDTEKLLSDKYYDIRIEAVTTGGEVDPINVKMMFCSNLGISFPDLNGHICSIVAQFESDSMGIDKFANEIEDTIFEDALVYPILHGSMTWLFSENIEGLYNTNPVMELPKFELINLN